VLQTLFPISHQEKLNFYFHPYNKNTCWCFSLSLGSNLGNEGTVWHEEGEADEDEHTGRHAAHRGSNPARIVDRCPTKKIGQYCSFEDYVNGIDQITIKAPNPKCRLYWYLKGTVYRLEIQSVIWIFSTPLVN